MVAHSRILLSKCSEFRREGEFIDVRLKVGDTLFPAHRVVLASYSDYFRAIFTDGKEANQELIELNEKRISPEIFKIVMDSIYSGDLHVNQKNVFEVLFTASQLQIASVVQFCCDFVKKEFIENGIDLKNYSVLCAVAERLGLTDLQEAAEAKMASIYKDVCESKEFLTHISADQLLNLLGRDDLNSPSEAFVFKSVMKWIRYKGEERMPVAGKVIGAVRLGLVDVKIVIKELKTEDMQRIPEVNIHLQESMMHHFVPSHEFAEEKMKPRSMRQVLVAIHPTRDLRSETFANERKTGGKIEEKAVSTKCWTFPCHQSEDAFAQYFDVDTKLWKPLASVAQLGELTDVCYSSELVGNYLYVVTEVQQQQGYFEYVVYRYHILNNTWEKLPKLNIGVDRDKSRRPPKIFLCSVSEYLYVIAPSSPPQRYDLSNNVWQAGEKLNFPQHEGILQFLAATVMNRKIYVIHNCQDRKNVSKPAVFHCFDPEKNEWERKASTCHPRFESSIFVVNNRLYVAGISNSIRNLMRDRPPVELYDERKDTWSVVEQKRIPPNLLGAFEIERRVYFLINNFPIDSGIRIPPEENFPVHLRDEWGNLAEVSENAVLCYLPVKKENIR